MLDLFCVADLCVDVLLRGNTRPRFSQAEQLIDDYTFEIGGSATICAGQFVNLGGSAGILGCVGDDLLGQFLLQRLSAIGLDLHHVRCDAAVKTGAGFALVEPHDRAILTYLGSIDAVSPGMLRDELLQVAKHWHVASYFLLTKLQHAWPQWLRKLRDRGVTISLDTNWAPDGDWHAVHELLPLVDWFLPNENEALAISGEEDLASAGEALADKGCGVVIKCGSEGAIAFRGQQQWRAASHNVKVVDTTGAGDCFDAGFIRAWQLGWPMERCLDLAVRCGAANVQAAGGFAGQLRERLR